MKQSYKVFKLGKQAVSGASEAGQFFGRWFSHSLTATSVFIVTSTTATGHTNSVGYLLSSSSASSCVNGGTDCYDIEVFYGTWHSMTMNAEGDLAIYQISNGSKTQVIGQSAQNGSQVPFTLAHSQTGTIPNPSNGVTPDYSDVNSAAYTSLQSVFTLGTDYFFHDDDADVLVGTPNGDVDNVYGHQSAIAVGLAPGTYRVAYDSATANGLSATWDPQLAISQATFTIGPGGSLSIQAPGTSRDITASNDIHTDLGNSSPTNAQLNYVFDGGTLIVGANLTDAFTIKSGGGTVSIASGDIYTMSGVISNATGATGSLTKTGAGALTVTGTNTYTGGTTVSAGTLDLDGSLTSDVTVASTGRIEGVGSTSGGLTSSGTVAPGNSPGTLSVAGNVVFTSTNTFITELDGLTYSAAGGAGTYDRLAVTGTTATFTAAGAIAPVLRGISAPANNTLDPVIGDAFRVVTTVNASGVSGAFSTVTDPTSGMPTNTRFDVHYGGNYVDLVLTPDDLSTFAAAYGIQNMVNAADAFDGIRPAQGTNGTTDKDKFFNGLYGLTAQETAVALLQASGEVHAFALSDARDTWSDGLGTVRSSSQGVGDYYWVDMSGYNLAVDEDTIASAYDSKTRKFWIGSDVYQDRSTTYGFALGVSESELSMANSGSADTTTYSLAAYMRGVQGAFEYDGLVSLNRSNVDTNRSVSLSTGSLSNTSSSDVRGLAMSAQLGYRYDVAPSLVSGLAWIKGDLDNTRTDTFTEDGSTVTALTVNGYEVKSAKVSVGYTLSGKIPNSGVEAGLWSFGVGAAKDVSRGMPDVSRTMSLHGASWSVSVPKAGDVTKFVSGGIAIPLGNDAVAELSLSAAKRDGALSKSAAFGFSAKW